MISPALCYSVALALLAAADSKPPAEAAKPDQRTELNLAGKVNAESGESRRNENVQFNLIDNNTRKELNARLGTSATIVDEFWASFMRSRSGTSGSSSRITDS